MSIGAIKMKLPKLQDDDKETKKLRLKRLQEDWKNILEVLHYQDLLYIPKVICSELISRYYNNPLIGRFGIKKT